MILQYKPRNRNIQYITGDSAGRLQPGKDSRIAERAEWTGSAVLVSQVSRQAVLVYVTDEDRGVCIRSAKGIYDMSCQGRRRVPDLISVPT